MSLSSGAGAGWWQGEFLSWLNVPANSHWLDVGCGTGALSQAILNLTPLARLRASIGRLNLLPSRVTGSEMGVRSLKQATPKR